MAGGGEPERYEVWACPGCWMVVERDRVMADTPWCGSCGKERGTLVPKTLVPAPANPERESRLREVMERLKSAPSWTLTAKDCHALADEIESCLEGEKP